MVCRLVTVVTELFLLLCHSILQNKIFFFVFSPNVNVWEGPCRPVLLTLKSSLATVFELTLWP